jgi:hypothetical protein
LHDLAKDCGVTLDAESSLGGKPDLSVRFVLVET